MTKITRDWQTVTGVRSAGRQMMGHLELNVTEVPIKKQIHLVSRKLKKIGNQIKRLIKKGNKGTPEMRADVAISIQRKNKLYFLTQKRLLLLEGKADAEVKREQTLYKEMKAHEQAVIENREKIIPNPVKTGRVGFHPVQQKEIDRVFGKDGQVKREKVFSGNNPPNEAVKVKNPNPKKGQVYLPKKGE